MEDLVEVETWEEIQMLKNKVNTLEKMDKNTVLKRR